VQVLKYELGQKYTVHHDYGAEDIHLACGPRILTFFLYLSDVEEGGETAFPSLNIAVKPKKGRALLWPSTLNDNPEAQDTRTFHEAKPVIQGTKMAANSWIHLYNFEKPNLWGCTGAFDEL
jgi:prolyl 4-hydroxylase